MKYSTEMIRKAVAINISIAGVMRSFGVRPSGGAYAGFKKLIEKSKADTSHFCGKGSNKGRNHRGGPDKKPASETLVKRNRLDAHEKGHRLRRALLEIGREEKCGICGLGIEWNGKNLKLQIDHMNGKRWDNRRENLRFVCPNCHSQTETFGAKNRKHLH